MASVIGTARIAAYGLVVLFAIIVLGLTAFLNSITTPAFQYAPYLFPFALAIISITIMVPLIAVDRFISGVPTSAPAVELIWSAILSMLWLSAAAYVTSSFVRFKSCGRYQGTSTGSGYDLASVCRVAQATQAFLWLGCIILIATFFTILILCVRESMANRDAVWTSNISDYNWSQKNDPNAASAAMYQQARASYFSNNTHYSQPQVHRPQPQRASASQPFVASAAQLQQSQQYIPAPAPAPAPPAPAPGNQSISQYSVHTTQQPVPSGQMASLYGPYYRSVGDAQ